MQAKRAVAPKPALRRADFADHHPYRPDARLITSRSSEPSALPQVASAAPNAEPEPETVGESYKWFELARQQLEAEGKANIDLKGKIEAALEQLSNQLDPQAVQEAKTRAAQWDPDAWRSEALPPMP